MEFLLLGLEDLMQDDQGFRQLQFLQEYLLDLDPVRPCARDRSSDFLIDRLRFLLKKPFTQPFTADSSFSEK